jgi:hypothetical protein
VGKWFGNIITTLVILALTSLLGASLKDPIDELASGDHLKAQVQLAPWIPRPPLTAKDEMKSIKSGENSIESVDSILEAENDKLSISSGDSFQLARAIITNESSKPIADASIRIEAPYTPQVVVVIEESGKLTTLRNAERIKLPIMRPGDKVGVFIWSNNLSSFDIEDYFKTYSSAGKFKLRFDWPSSQIHEYDSGFGQFLDNWAVYALVASTIMLTVFLAILATAQSNYLKGLLSSEKLYYSERAKFEADPQKFTPAYSDGEKASKIKNL